jgi:hypothetical protein
VEVLWSRVKNLHVRAPGKVAVPLLTAEKAGRGHGVAHNATAAALADPAHFRYLIQYTDHNGFAEVPGSERITCTRSGGIGMAGN